MLLMLLLQLDRIEWIFQNVTYTPSQLDNTGNLLAENRVNNFFRSWFYSFCVVGLIVFLFAHGLLLFDGNKSLIFY